MPRTPLGFAATDNEESVVAVPRPIGQLHGREEILAVKVSIHVFTLRAFFIYFSLFHSMKSLLVRPPPPFSPPRPLGRQLSLYRRQS